MKNPFLSRKFLLALATAILVVLNDGFGMGLNSDSIMNIVKIVLGWIFVEGSLDLTGIIKGLIESIKK